MAREGQKYQTGERCDASDSYVFECYADGSTEPEPREREQVIYLAKGEVFPRVKKRAARWKVQGTTDKIKGALTLAPPGFVRNCKVAAGVIAVSFVGAVLLHASQGEIKAHEEIGWCKAQHEQR